jgi:Flp pilus assembly protein TadB
MAIFVRGIIVIAVIYGALIGAAEVLQVFDISRASTLFVMVFAGIVVLPVLGAIAAYKEKKRQEEFAAELKKANELLAQSITEGEARLKEIEQALDKDLVERMKKGLRDEQQ